jgi:hypothetical protein
MVEGSNHREESDRNCQSIKRGRQETETGLKSSCLDMYDIQHLIISKLVMFPVLYAEMISWVLVSESPCIIYLLCKIFTTQLPIE